MSFSPVVKQRAADQVAASLRDAILSGQLKTGDALPSERDLAAQLAVNRSTVREAITQLVAWGLVTTRHGGKTRVRDVLASASLAILPWLLAPGGQINVKVVRDLLALRTALLGFAAGAAVAHLTPEGLTQLSALVDDLDAAATPADAQDLDWRFFDHLVRVGDNQVLVLLIAAIAPAYAEHRLLFSALYAAPDFDTRHHRAFLRAASAGDAPAAAASLEAYGRTAQERLS